MRYYIAGPIFGKPEGNKSAFAAMADHIRWLGHTPVNPWDLNAEHAGPCKTGSVPGMGGGHTSACYMKADLEALVACDGVVFLLDWERSSGAFVEFTVARSLGLDLHFAAAPTYVPGLSNQRV